MNITYITSSNEIINNNTVIGEPTAIITMNELPTILIPMGVLEACMPKSPQQKIHSQRLQKIDVAQAQQSVDFVTPIIVCG